MKKVEFFFEFAVSTDRQTTVKEAEGVIKKHLRADIDVSSHSLFKCRKLH